ncbi:MAG: MerR family transcriptional regulator [Clostridia bacterium]|nr:MerR family transcriptional regulator [Clostridia bacterium]
MYTVHQVSGMAGVSVRTLHHYDQLGLLKPSQVTQAGYRLYDDAALVRLQSILIYREVGLPLREIKAIMDDPAYDPREALRRQITLLDNQRQRLEGIIAFARDMEKKGEIRMDFQVFDKSEQEQLQAEAKAKWGQTDAWQAWEQQGAKHSHQQKTQDGNRLMMKLAAIGAMRGQAADSGEVQQEIAALQQLISDCFYPCSKEVLRGLGQMYVTDERFTRNIDKAGGEGTAQFVHDAIEVYCKD